MSNPCLFRGEAPGRRTERRRGVIRWVLLCGAGVGLLAALVQGLASPEIAGSGEEASSASLPQRRLPPRPALSLRQACVAAGIAFPPRSLRMEVRKAARILVLYAGQTRIKQYRVALGGKPDGDKLREGDLRTPEGEFYVCTRLPKSRFHRFLGISYPAPDDARAALLAGRISRSQAQAIETAHRRKRQPPWNTPLGGAVGIHGGGTATDWTLGCVALTNDDMDELFPHVRVGTRVVIYR